MVLSNRTTWLLPWIFLLTSTALWADEFSSPREFITQVLERHPAVLKDRSLVRAAEFGVKGSHHQPNPVLTVAATAGEAGESANALTQNFEISGQPELRWKQSTAELESAKNQLRATRRQVAGQAYRSWISYWRAVRQSELAVLRTELFQEVSRAARRRFEVGEISENESLRVELAAVQAQVALSKASAELESTRRDLLLLAGRDLEEDLFLPAEPVQLLDSCTLTEALDAVLSHPEIVSMKFQREALESAGDLIAKERGPILGLSLYRSTLFRTSGVEQGAQLSLSFPIADWGSISNRRRQAQAQAESYALGIEEIVLERLQEISQTWARLEAARSNRSVLQSQAERYEELARESRIAYDLGLVSLTDALQTETAFRQARVELVEVEFKLFELELALLERTGLPWPEELGSLEKDT